MLSATSSRFSFSLGFSSLRARPLDEVARQRVEALLWAGREDAAVTAYRQATHAPYRTAARAVARLKASLDAQA